jgi:Zn finger protein HypA/HybF involved in hydrogenase expression
MVTIYNASAECPECQEWMNPVEAIMGGTTGLCPQCRNLKFIKRVKGRMA